MKSAIVLSCATILLLCGFAAAETPAAKFVKKPTAVRDGDRTRIDFAVDRATDVAVFIEDGQGKVVRHLVAGVLGKNPPAPLKKDALEQSVIWDGQFDRGIGLAGLKPVGPFKVRVTLGTQAKFDGVLLHNPAASGAVPALAVGLKGEVYVFHRDATGNANMGGYKLKVYDRNGGYLRTLMPPPADLPADRLKALGVLQAADGALVPVLNNYEQISFYPDPLGSRGKSMPGFSSPVVDRQGRVYWMMQGGRLACVDRDGGIPYPTFYSEPLLAGRKTLRLNTQYGYQFDRPSLAVSSDGQWLYLAGLFDGTSEKDGKPVPAVFRVNPATRGPAEVFLGDPDKSGADDKLLASPRGLAVVDGLLYVCDFANDRIVAFKEADKSLVGQVKIAKPDTLGVDAKTGAIYVCCSTSKTTADLVKIENLKTGKELYRSTLPRHGGNPWDFEHRIAVYASASPVFMWMPGIGGRQGLTRIEDAGDKFTAPADPRDLKTVWAEGPRDMNVDRVRDELYVKGNPARWYRLNEKTGQLIDSVEPNMGSSVNSGQLIPWFDGKLYTWSWNTGFMLFDRMGKPVNWPGQSTHCIPLGGVMCFQERHLEVISPEELLIVLNPQWFYEKYDLAKHPQKVLFPDRDVAPPPGRGDLRTSVGVIGPDGRLKRTVIWQCMPGATPRMDEQGNIYLAEIVKPAGRSWPPFFDGKLDPSGGAKRTYGPAFWTSYVYGSILKFPPSGGIVWHRPGLPAGVVGEPPADLLAKPKTTVRIHMAHDLAHEGEVQGAEWMHFGFAPYSCWSNGSTDLCMCEGSRFDVDGFGRVFLPNLGQFRVEIIDTNANPIATFGQYGNEDFPAGGKSAAAGKATGDGIPMAWPTAVAASDTHVYVGDTLNRRVVKVKLVHAAEETCAIR